MFDSPCGAQGEYREIRERPAGLSEATALWLWSEGFHGASNVRDRERLPPFAPWAFEERFMYRLVHFGVLRILRESREFSDISIELVVHSILQPVFGNEWASLANSREVMQSLSVPTALGQSGTLTARRPILEWRRIVPRVGRFLWRRRIRLRRRCCFGSRRGRSSRLLGRPRLLCRLRGRAG